MKPQAALAAVTTLVVALAATLAPALAARGSYVIDDAHMLSSGAIAQINQQVGDFNAQTGKEVLVVTTDSLNGQPANAALERSFAQNQVNGVEIFIAKNEKQIKIAGDVASRRFFPSGSFDTIYQAMKPSFVQGNFDQGVETGVGLILNTYRGHESSLNRGRVPAGAGAGTTSRVQHNSSGGSGLGWIWWIIILAVIFFVIRGIFRAMSGPRMYGGGAGYGPGPGYGPGYGGYGGGMGGGGGFWSGLLGGLGGAWLATTAAVTPAAGRGPARAPPRTRARPTRAAGRATPARSTPATSAAAAGATPAAETPAAAGAAVTAAAEAATPAAAGSADERSGRPGRSTSFTASARGT